MDSKSHSKMVDIPVKPEDSENLDNSLYNHALLKAHFGIRTFQDVNIIVDYAGAEGIAQASHLKAAGIPFIIRGHQGWAKFTEKWVKLNNISSMPTSSGSTTKGGKRKVDMTSSSDMMVETSYEIDTKQMIKDIGDELVPIVRPDYDPEDPIKKHITVKEFLEEAWIPELPKYYLHQWQFPLASDHAMRKLCLQSNPLPTLGLDLLQFGHDSCVVDDMIDSPFQYLFMGQRDTYSKMHRDTGGMSIIIAPIIGKKELTLVHREDGRLLYHCTAPVAHPDYINYPLSAFMRAWKTIISRGDILVLPPGTYHAAKNIEPCLSYSRFHVDAGDMMSFVNSWIANDAPSVHHREVIWNSCIELIKLVDIQAQSLQNRIVAPDTTNNGMLIIRDAFPTLSMLRHVIQTIVNMNNINDHHKPSSSVSYKMMMMEVDVDEWKALLHDVDTSIRQYLVSDLAQRPYLRTNLIKKDTSNMVTSTMSASMNSNMMHHNDMMHHDVNQHLCEIMPHHQDDILDHDDDIESSSSSCINEYQLLQTMQSSSPSSSSPTTYDNHKNPNHRRSSHDDDSDDDGQDKVVASTSSNKKAKLDITKLDTSNDVPAVEHLRDKKGNLLYVGSLVNVGLFKEAGTIEELWKKKNCVQIHYEGFEAMYDEYVGVEDITDISGSQIRLAKLYENMKVMAFWGEFKDQYLAQILPLCTWKAGRKSTKYKEANNNITAYKKNHDPHSHDGELASIHPEIREKVDNVLYQGPVVRIRFPDEKSKDKKSSYLRLFPLAQVVKKRIYNPTA